MMRVCEQEFHASDLSRRARKIVAAVAALNFLGFVMEIVLASVSGSAALYADAADFLEDTLINVLVLTALGWSVASRRKASYGLAALLFIPASAALATVVWKLMTGTPPEAVPMSLTAAAAMIINLVCAVLLMRLRSADSALMRGTWLVARNDVLANALIVAAGVTTMFWFSIWPDVAVGLIIAAINIGAAKEVFEQARAEDPELEMDED